MYRAFIIIFIIIIFSFAECKSQSYSKKEYYRPQTGLQVLNSDGSWSIPLNPRGYSLFLPKPHSVGTIVFIMSNVVDEQTEEFECVKVASENGISVLYVSTGIPADFMFSESEAVKVWSDIKTILIENGLFEKPFVLSGLSLGGTRALKLTEYLLNHKQSKPAGIILVDAPLDMERFWHSHEKVKTHSKNEIAVNAATWINFLLEKNLGGSPAQAPDRYKSYSPYSYRLTDERKLSLFLDIPIVAWHEEDVAWWMQNRSKDYYSTNSVDLAAFINELTLRGHTHATLFTTHDQAKMKGLSTPHNWKIVDQLKFIEQVLVMIK